MKRLKNAKRKDKLSREKRGEVEIKILVAVVADRGTPAPLPVL